MHAVHRYSVDAVNQSAVIQNEVVFV